VVEFDSVAGLAFATDDLTDAFKLLRHPLIGGDNVIEGIGDFSDEAVLLAGHPDRKIAGAHRAKSLQQVLKLDRGG
jgi:hypothetical protein